MLVSVTGFGSVWRQRLEPSASWRLCPVVYYNTTGVMVKGGLRQRPQICGYARFDAIGGFNPNYPSKMIGRVFECAEPSVWMGCNRLLFRRLARRGSCAERFLLVASSDLNGHFAVGTEGWRSPDTWLLSFSECGGNQELMLLMDGQGWIQSDLGRFVVGLSELRPLPARLTLCAR
ncbi:MAG: hypothetical protein JST79_00140 [Acidobacteria bacterium]|nr:hypothetical protein [Acidobacteriota bacterium]